jgi:hypothetical protein
MAVGDDSIIEVSHHHLEKVIQILGGSLNEEEILMGLNFVENRFMKVGSHCAVRHFIHALHSVEVFAE